MVACEQHVLAGYGADRSLIARVGLIGGPGDLFDRSGYCPGGSAAPLPRTAGLVTRPLADTLADALAWEPTRKPAPTRQAGLSDTDERALLDLLTADQRAAARIV